MSYKSGHIYLVDKEPTNEELANFSKPVQFDICKDGLFYSILYDKNGNRYVEDRSKITTGFIKLGTIVRVGNVINIGVHPSGFNHWRINGVDVTSSNPVVLELEPETVLYRIDSIVGNSAGGIFIFQGDADKNPLPTNSLNYPNYAFFKDVLITPNSGGSIDPEILNNYVSKEEESWKEITLGISSDFVIDYSDERTRFKISSLGSAAHTLTGIVFSDDTDRAVEFWIYNNTGEDININNVATSGLRKGFQIYGEPFKIIANGKAVLKYNPATDIIECWKDNSTGGGISTVTSDATLQGTGSPTEPLGLSASKNAEISGKTTMTAVQTWVNQQKGIANGLATLNDSGIIPSSQLPSYVDDVIEVTNYGTLPTTGETGKIYVILNASGGYQANQQFRWSGGGYIALVASPGTTDNVPEGTNNKYYTDARVNAYVATLGYVTTSSFTTALNLKENSSNKVTTWSSTPSNTRYPSEKLVKDTIDNLITSLTQPLKVITSNTTLDDTYHNAIVRIESNVTINVPANLRNDFNCVFEAIGNVTGTFVATSPAVISAPFGLILRDNTMATLYKYATNTYRLNGGTIPA